MSENIQIVIKPASMRKGEELLVSQCGTIDGAVRMQLSVPLSQIPRSLLEAEEGKGNLVVDFSINGVYASDVPIKTGTGTSGDYDKAMKRRGNLLNENADFELRSNVVDESD